MLLHFHLRFFLCVEGRISNYVSFSSLKQALMIMDVSWSFLLHVFLAFNFFFETCIINWTMLTRLCFSACKLIPIQPYRLGDYPRADKGAEGWIGITYFGIATAGSFARPSSRASLSNLTIMLSFSYHFAYFHFQISLFFVTVLPLLKVVPPHRLYPRYIRFHLSGYKFYYKCVKSPSGSHFQRLVSEWVPFSTSSLRVGHIFNV